MADAEAQPPEIFAAEVRDNVLQTVMPAVPAAHLQARHSRWQIQFVVHHQHLCRRNLVELRQRADGASAYVHKRLRLEKQHLLSDQMAARRQTVKLGLALEAQIL